MTQAEAYPTAGTVTNLRLAYGSSMVSELSNSPNPFAEFTTVSFTLEATTTATLLVQNLQGQLIRSYEIEGVAGLNRQTITRADLGGVTGVLTYTVVADGYTATKQLVVR